MSAHRSVLRIDRAELASPKRLDNGWLRADGFISRTGVQTYRRDDGTEWAEYRPAEEVFHADTLASFELVPVTIEHPPSGRLDATNARLYQVGTVGEPRRAGEKTQARILITDASAVEAIDRGKSELSCGYLCDLEVSAGEHEGVHYDAVQRNIRGNHVALTSNARGGKEIRLRVDTFNAEVVALENNDAQRGSRMEGNTTTEDKIDAEPKGIAKRLAKVAAELGEASERLSNAEKSIEREKARADAAEAEVKTLKAKVDAAPAQAREEVKARIALEAKAREILGSEAKVDALDALSIKRAVAEKVNGLKLDGKAEAYVEAAYEIACAKADATSAISSGRADTREVADAGDDSIAAHQAKFNEAARNAWKTSKVK